MNKVKMEEFSMHNIEKIINDYFHEVEIYAPEAITELEQQENMKLNEIKELIIKAASSDSIGSLEDIEELTALLYQHTNYLEEFLETFHNLICEAKKYEADV